VAKDEEVADLRQRAETLRGQQQRIEAQAEAAKGEYDRQLEKLKSDFNVDSEEEARALLDRIDAELDAEVEKVRSALDRTERPEE